jgi:hypothetical protein
MLSLTNLQILNIIILVSFGFTKANLIPTDSLENSLEKPLKSTSASSASSSASSLPYDDISGSDNDKNDDDSHIRLYYKSNSPNQYISQELEHRFSKNSNYPYNQRLSPQPKLSNQFDLNNYYRNYPYNQLPSAQSYFMDNNNKNKHTMLNLHYHGNTVDGIFLFIPLFFGLFKFTYFFNSFRTRAWTSANGLSVLSKSAGFAIEKKLSQNATNESFAKHEPIISAAAAV